MIIKIGQLAKITGCKVVTIRYYEKEGLLKTPTRSGAQYRLYNEKDVERLRFILHCRQHGMSLNEIRNLLAYADSPDVCCEWINELVKRHIADIEKQMADLSHLKKHLESLYEKCDGSQKGNCGIIQSLTNGENCSLCQKKRDETANYGLEP